MGYSSDTEGPAMESSKERVSVKGEEQDEREAGQAMCTWTSALRVGGLYAGYTTMGIAHTLIGTTLLEMQVQTGVSIDQLSYLLTWSFLGRISGSFLASTIFDRLHPEMQLASTLLVSVLTSGLVPLAKSYPLLSIGIAIQGVCIGFTGTGASAHLFDLCTKHTGPFVQAFFFAFSFGCAMAPPIAQPFLTESKTAVTSLGITHDIGNISSNSNLTSNVTTLLNDTQSQSAFIHPGTFYPFVILAAIQVVVMAFQLVLFACNKCHPLRKPSSRNTSETSGEVNKLLLALFALLTITCGIETTYGSLLYTYVVKYLSWEPVTANNLAFVYWISFSLSRALGILHAKFITPDVALVTFISLMITSLVIMAAADHVSPVVTWVCAPCMGLALSTQTASIYLYAGKYFQMSARISGILLTSLYVSGMSNPALTGYLYKHVSEKWYQYIQIICGVLMLFVFLSIRCFGRRCTDQQHEIRSEFENQPINSGEDKS